MIIDIIILVCSGVFKKGGLGHSPLWQHFFHHWKNLKNLVWPLLCVSTIVASENLPPPPFL